MTAPAYSFPPARKLVGMVWPGDVLPLVGGTVAGIHEHNSHPRQPITLTFRPGAVCPFTGRPITRQTFERTDSVYVSSPRRIGR